MGQRPVKPGAEKATKTGGANWTLTAPHLDNAQGLIVRAFKTLPFGEALLLELPPKAGGAWLRALTGAIPITDAGSPRSPPSTAAALALTRTGLRATGLDEDTLATFSPAFVEGMRQIDRQRRLGDGVLDPVTNRTVVSKDTVISGGPLWSGNAPELYRIVEEPDPMAEEPGAEDTPTTVHAALLLYAVDQPQLNAQIAAAEAALVPSGVKIVRRIELSLKLDNEGRVREHFGFVDGISQPIPYGPTIDPNKRDPWHGVAAGDLLIGHLTTDGDPAPGPVVSDTLPGADELPPGEAPHGFRDLGLDGTYLVIRELQQDVKAFWRSMVKAAGTLDRSRDHAWLAERVVGRTLTGDPLAPEKDGGFIPKQDKEPANDFGYFENDPHGLGCPKGSHMRRANPRDGLAPNPGDAKAFRSASNNHRILRRGRKFGPVFDGLAYAERLAQNPEAEPQPETPDSERGLLFIAINTDITRQFEFVQQTWVFNKCFAALSGESDPLVGPRGPFTVPEEPLRALPEVDTFVRLVGGDYFFLPSLPALKYLARLP
jgi:Dyp-type peroxidase family